MGFFKSLFKIQDKSTVELNTSKSKEWTTLIEDTPIVLKTNKDIESFVATLEKGSRIAKLEKIQKGTKKQRIKNKLQKRIDAYGK